MKSWHAWFTAALAKYPTPDAYYAEYKAYHKPLYDAVVRTCPPPARLLEVGSALGFSSRSLSDLGYTVTELEPDEAMRTMADHVGISRGRRFGITLGQATVAEDLGPHDVAFSSGVIEHEDFPTRLLMLGQLALLAPVIVVCIPSPLLLEVNPPLMGERTIPLDELTAEVDAAGLDVVEAFGWGTFPDREGFLSLCVVGRRASVHSQTDAD
jgi:hypothetical protein